MTTLMFKERFAAKVASGDKQQTIRPQRAHPIKVGEALSLRKWEGLPYRSRQVELVRAVCVRTTPIEILSHSVILDTNDNLTDRLQDFAIADGFESWGHMRDWFDETHGLPFVGVLIKWELQL